MEAAAGQWAEIVAVEVVVMEVVEVEELVVVEVEKAGFTGHNTGGATCGLQATSGLDIY